MTVAIPRGTKGFEYDMGNYYTPNVGYSFKVPYEDPETKKVKEAEEYRPNQKDFHEARYGGYQFRAIFAGWRGGKTLAGLAEVLFWVINFPGCVGWAGEPIYGMNETILLPTLKKLLGLDEWQELTESPLVRKYNKTKHKIIWFNGSVTWLGSCEKPDHIVGGTWDYFFLDEAFDIRYFEETWKVLSSRLSGTGKLPDGMEPQGWVTTTPTPKGTPLYYAFIDPVRKKERSTYFMWSQRDNPHLTERYLNSQNAEHKTESDRAMFIEGRFPDIGIGSYEFDFKKHVLDRENIYGLTDIPPRASWRKVAFCIDWGWDAPCVIIALVFDKDYRVYVVDEWYATGATDKEILEVCHEIRNLYSIDGRNREIFWCDPEEPKTIDLLVDHGFDARKNEFGRKDGIREMGGRFKLAGDGKPRIFIHPNCSLTLEEVVVYDTAVKEYDHAMDTIRYGIINTVAEVPHKAGSVGKPRSRGRRKRSPLSGYQAIKTTVGHH